MTINMLYSAHNNNISISSSNFTTNRATHHCGGGVDIGFYLLYQRSPAEGNRIDFYNCTFQRNTALYGGGTTVFSDLPNENLSKDNTVTFRNCSWLENSAKYSAAVDISPNAYANVLGGFHLAVRFTDCCFIRNYVKSGVRKDVKIAFGSGTFMITAIDVVFDQTTNFIENNGTA